MILLSLLDGQICQWADEKMVMNEDDKLKEINSSRCKIPYYTSRFVIAAVIASVQDGVSVMWLARHSFQQVVFNISLLSRNVK